MKSTTLFPPQPVGEWYFPISACVAALATVSSGSKPTPAIRNPDGACDYSIPAASDGHGILPGAQTAPESSV